MASPSEDQERANLLVAAPSKDKAEAGDQAENKQGDLVFKEFIARITGADPYNYPQLHDPLMKAFCEQAETTVQSIAVNISTTMSNTLFTEMESQILDVNLQVEQLSVIRVDAGADRVTRRSPRTVRRVSECT